MIFKYIFPFGRLYFYFANLVSHLVGYFFVTDFFFFNTKRKSSGRVFGCSTSGLRLNAEELGAGFKSPLRPDLFSQKGSHLAESLQETELYPEGRLACPPLRWERGPSQKSLSEISQCWTCI